MVKYGLVIVSVVSMVAILAGDVMGQPIPLRELQGRWTPTSLDNIQISAIRLDILPSMDERSNVLWTVDETILLRNFGEESVSLDLAVPNIWSIDDPSVLIDNRDFWGEVHLNGRRVSTELVDLILNPAFPFVDVRVARRFEVDLAGGQSIHVRLQFNLPMVNRDNGERGLSYPFQLARLYDGTVEYGVIVLRWTEHMFAFRSNLSAFSLYGDRVEWFLLGFEPTGNLDVMFVPRTSVFSLVAGAADCPMPWEVIDRVSDGDPESLHDMLDPYPTDTLRVCASLPGTLRGSLADSIEGGLRDLRLEQFATEGSGLEGPLFVENPAYRESDLSDTEAVYSRFLRQEVVLRRQ